MLIVKCTCSYSPWLSLSPTDDPLQLHFLFYSSGPVMTMMVRLIVFPSLLLLTPSQIQLVVCVERKKAKKPCATTKHKCWKLFGFAYSLFGWPCNSLKVFFMLVCLNCIYMNVCLCVLRSQGPYKRRRLRCKGTKRKRGWMFRSFDAFNCNWGTKQGRRPSQVQIPSWYFPLNNQTNEGRKVNFVILM